MFDQLTKLGYGVVVFAIIIGVGTVVLYNFGTATNCPTSYTYNETATNCYYTTNSSITTARTGAGTNMDYLTTQLGQSGLAGWTPAIIAISVGILFLGAFMVGQGNKRRY